LSLKLLAVTAAVVVAFLGIKVARSTGAIEDIRARGACDKIASPVGSNEFPGTTTRPFATVEKLANSLEPGQTGCLRAGVYDGYVKFMRGGTAGAPITLMSFPGERATVRGRIHVADEANHVVVQQLELDGRNDEDLPSPTINGNHVVFRDNDVTNHNTTICFLLGSTDYGRARNTTIERNRIHNCGALPPTNHHHGVYVGVADGARVIDNWIYDNADRGVQLFPDAQRTYVARNVIDGNGQGVIFSRESSNNTVELNVISNPVVRYNIEDYELSGGGNVARLNCVWSTRHPGNAGIQPDIEVPVRQNFVTDPGYVSRQAKDFRLQPDSRCKNLPASAVAAVPQPAKERMRRRPVRLRANSSTVRPGQRLRLGAQVEPGGAQTPSRRAVLKLFRGGVWLRVGIMRLRGRSYTATVRLARRKRGVWLRFGRTRVAAGRRTLRLRAYVPQARRSNMVLVRVRR
jgi:Right handed beta helix region